MNNDNLSNTTVETTTNPKVQSDSQPDVLNELPKGNNTNNPSGHNFQEMDKLLKEMKAKIQILEKENETLKNITPQSPQIIKTDETIKDIKNNPDFIAIQNQVKTLRDSQLENQFKTFANDFKKEYAMTHTQFTELFSLFEKNLPSNTNLDNEVFALLEKSPAILKGTLLALDPNFFLKTPDRKKAMELKQPIIRGNSTISHTQNTPPKQTPLQNTAYTINDRMPWNKK